MSQRLQDNPQISKDLGHFTFEIEHELFIPKWICSHLLFKQFHTSILPCIDATKDRPRTRYKIGGHIFFERLLIICLSQNTFSPPEGGAVVSRLAWTWTLQKGDMNQVS